MSTHTHTHIVLNPICYTPAGAGEVGVKCGGWKQGVEVEKREITC